MPSTPFIPGTETDLAACRQARVVSVDLGFARTRPSCGVAWKEPDKGTSAESLTFSQAIQKVAELVGADPEGTLLLESPLSCLFDRKGNPAPRMDFEQVMREGKKKHRYWYYGAGASTCLAAIAFLRRLSHELEKVQVEQRTIYLFEGFASFKDGTTDHREDARRLLNAFLGNDASSQWHTVSPTERGTVLTVLDILGSSPGGSVAPAVLVVQSE